METRRMESPRRAMVVKWPQGGDVVAVDNDYSE
jgi:hypothetical protein